LKVKLVQGCKNMICVGIELELPVGLDVTTVETDSCKFPFASKANMAATLLFHFPG